MVKGQTVKKKVLIESNGTETYRRTHADHGDRPGHGHRGDKGDKDMSQTDPAQNGRMPERLVRRCPSEGREKLFMLDGDKRTYRCGCGRSAAEAAGAVREMNRGAQDTLPASLRLTCPRENNARTFSRMEGTTVYECPSCGAEWDTGTPGQQAG